MKEHSFNWKWNPLPGWVRECTACHRLVGCAGWHEGMRVQGSWFCSRLCVPAFWRRILVGREAR